MSHREKKSRQSTPFLFLPPCSISPIPSPPPSHKGISGSSTCPLDTIPIFLPKDLNLQKISSLIYLFHLSLSTDPFPSAFPSKLSKLKKTSLPEPLLSYLFPGSLKEVSLSPHSCFHAPHPALLSTPLDFSQRPRSDAALHSSARHQYVPCC